MVYVVLFNITCYGQYRGVGGDEWPLQLKHENRQDESDSDVVEY